MAPRRSRGLVVAREQSLCWQRHGLALFTLLIQRHRDQAGLWARVGPVPPSKIPHPPPSDWQSSALHSAQSTEPADVEGVETEPGQVPSTLCRDLPT